MSAKRQCRWLHKWEHVGFVGLFDNIADPIERVQCAKCGAVQDREVLA